MEQWLDISVGVGGFIVAVATILIVRFARVNNHHDETPK